MSKEPQQTDSRLLGEFLAARDFACPACGYNLRGLTSDRCPECNLELALTVRLAEPRMAAFIAGLVGLACGMGFSGLLTLYFVAHIAAGGTLLKVVPDVLVTGTPFLIEGLALTLWVRSRGKLLRAAARPRTLLVIGTWALTAANFTAFLLWLN